MSADVLDRRTIQRMRQTSSSEIVAESVFILEILGSDPMDDGTHWEQVAPETCGALTSAPLISDGSNIYGYMDYAISNFLEKLIAGETIPWQKGCT